MKRKEVNKTGGAKGMYRNRSRPQGGERFKFENNAFEISKGLEFVPYIPFALSISSTQR